MGDILFVHFVSDDWSNLYQSRHAVVKEFAKNYKCLWVQQPKYKGIVRRFNVSFFKSELRNVDNNIWALSFNFHQGINPNVSQHKIRQTFTTIYRKFWSFYFNVKLQRTIKGFNAKKVVYYIWRPTFKGLVTLNKGDYSIYHVDDDYSWGSRFSISDNEKYFLKHTDLSVIHSKSLFLSRSKYSKNCLQTSNGVNFDHFYEVSRDHSIVEFKKKNSRPIIGYVGWLKKHLDLVLLQKLVEKRPNYDFVFVGGIREKHEGVTNFVKNLRHYENVKFVGSCDYVDLPRYIGTFTVGIMPYRNNSYTRHIYPMKLHEYLACGVGVVSTPLENIDYLANVINFASGTKDWLIKIDKEVENYGMQHKVDERIEVAREHSWENRTFEIREYILNQLYS